MQGLQDKMSVMRSEAASTLCRWEAKKSWQNPFLTEAQREALCFLKVRADGLNLGVKRMTDAFAPGMEVNFSHALQFLHDRIPSSPQGVGQHYI